MAECQHPTVGAKAICLYVALLSPLDHLAYVGGSFLCHQWKCTHSIKGKYLLRSQMLHKALPHIGVICQHHPPMVMGLSHVHTSPGPTNVSPKGY